MKPKISIIVPVYKAEDTLDKCLQSILSQTFTDFEVILIDDGSPDNSGHICDEYELHDHRIRIIHKQNEGVSAARQNGVDEAKGEYTIHVDPDDWIEPTMLEELYEHAVDTKADMVICDFYENTRKSQTYVKQTPSLNNDELLVQLFSTVMGSTCNKLIKTECYKIYDVQFPREFNYCEDLYVIASFVAKKISISYLNKAFYHYVKDNSLLSQSKFYDENSYQTDLIMERCFNSLLQGSAAENICKEAMQLSIISRAFYFGYSHFSDQLFKSYFSSFIPLVKRSKKNMLEKVLLEISCRGYYSVAYHILQFLKVFNKALKR